jgi:hypothetical protein
MRAGGQPRDDSSPPSPYRPYSRPGCDPAGSTGHAITWRPRRPSPRHHHHRRRPNSRTHRRRRLRRRSRPAAPRKPEDRTWCTSNGMRLVQPPAPRSHRHFRRATPPRFPRERRAGIYIPPTAAAPPRRTLRRNRPRRRCRMRTHTRIPPTWRSHPADPRKPVDRTSHYLLSLPTGYRTVRQTGSPLPEETRILALTARAGQHSVDR